MSVDLLNVEGVHKMSTNGNFNSFRSVVHVSFVQLAFTISLLQSRFYNFVRQTVTMLLPLSFIKFVQLGEIECFKDSEHSWFELVELK